MQRVEKAAIEANCWENNPKNWTKVKTLRVYDMINHRFKYKYKDGHRFHELNWMTIKNKVYYNKGKLVGEASGSELVTVTEVGEASGSELVTVTEV